jgi:hypothetical protein
MEEAGPMTLTTEELAAAVIAETGILILSFDDPVPIGFLCRGIWLVGHGGARQPSRVVRQATLAEAKRQRALLAALRGMPDDRPLAPFYYVVETD